MIRSCIHRLPCIIRKSSTYFLCSKKTNTFCRTRSLHQKLFCLPFQKYKISLPLFKKDAGYLITISISNIAVIYVHVINRLLNVCRLLPIKSLPSSILIKTRSSHKKLRRKGLQTISWNPVLQSLILAMSVCLFFITDIDLNTVFERCQKKSCNHAKQKRIHQICRLMLLIHKSSSHAIIYTIAWFSCIRKHNHSMYKNHSLLHLIRTLFLSFVYA